MIDDRKGMNHMENLLEVQSSEMETIDLRNWVTKSNELIESTYKLSLQEQRILLVLASKVQPTDETLKTYRFRARDFIEIVGNKKGTGFYSYLKDTVNGLQTKVLTIKKDGKQRNYNWVITSIYEDNEGYITLQFHPELKNFFLALKEKFTSYQLENVVRLNSVYSIRIYELLKQYERIKRRELSLQELREILAIDPTKYKQYGHFKSKVLLVAQKEINEKTDIHFDFNEKKTGRKVTGIEFVIGSNKPKKVMEETRPEDYSAQAPLDSLEKELYSIGISKEKVNALFKTFSKERIIRNLDYARSRHENGTVIHLGAYLLKAIQEDYADNAKGKPKEPIPEWFHADDEKSADKEPKERQQAYFAKRGSQEEFEAMLLGAMELKMKLERLNITNPDELKVVGRKTVAQMLQKDMKERKKVGLETQKSSEFKNKEIRGIYESMLLEQE